MITFAFWQIAWDAYSRARIIELYFQLHSVIKARRAFRTALVTPSLALLNIFCNEFCAGILTCSLTKSYWCRNLNGVGEKWWSAFSYGHNAHVFFFDFFLWGHVKSEIYSRPVRKVAELKWRIKRNIKNIAPETLRRVVDALPTHYRECVRRHRGHLDNVIFHGEDIYRIYVQKISVIP